MALFTYNCDIYQSAIDSIADDRIHPSLNKLNSSDCYFFPKEISGKSSCHPPSADLFLLFIALIAAVFALLGNMAAPAPLTLFQVWRWNL